MLRSVSNLKVRGLGFQNTPDCCGKCLAITIQNKSMKRNNAKENSVYNYNPPLRPQRDRKARCCFCLLSLSSVKLMSKPKILLPYLNDNYAFYQGYALAVPGDPWHLTLAPRCLKNL